MILVDFSNVMSASCYGAAYSNEADAEVSPKYLLGKIRNINVDFRKKYGELVICADHRSWRIDEFPEYKWRRRNRDLPPEQQAETDERYEIINRVFNALEQLSPYRCIRVQGAEGDDVISVLSRDSRGKNLVVSEDKDLSQLKSSNVDCYRPIRKEFVDNGPDFLKTMILTGDPGDGIPNFLSDDNVFKEGIRQTPLRKKIKEQMLDAIDPIQEIDDLPDVKNTTKEKMKDNYERNRRMIDLSQIPQYVVDRIEAAYHAQDNKKPDLLSLFTTLNAGFYVSHTSDFAVVQNF